MQVSAKIKNNNSEEIMGNINVYSGPMKCGKTQQVLNEYKRQLITGKKVIMFKPNVDTREGADIVKTRNGIGVPSIGIDDISELKKYDADIYCIDEFQFLTGDVSLIQNMADNGKSFYISGLNLTAEKKPFGKMNDLLCIADNVNMLTAICSNCKNENAVYSFFKGNKDQEIVIGDEEYMPLCRHCYEELNNK
jgi:thymidine kinase